MRREVTAFPVKELRAAAATLLRISKAVETGPPWGTCDAPGVVVSGAAGSLGSWVAHSLSHGDADWIALVDPGLAGPLGALLDHAAEQLDAFLRSGNEVDPTLAAFEFELAVARWVNASEVELVESEAAE